jgi:hypothetical protein
VLSHSGSRRASRWCLLVVAALIAQVGCSAGPSQDLRGPGRRKGETFRTESRTVMKNGKAVVRVGKESQEGSCEMTMTSVEEEQILAVEGRRVTKQQTTVLTDEMSLSVRIAGEHDNGTERGALVGEKILREFKDGKWKNTLVGKEPTAKQQKELDSLDPLEDGGELYPEGPVKPGHTWKVDPARLRKFFGPSCTALSGEASMTFVRTTTLDGESCILINFTMNVKGKLLEDNNEMDFELRVKGPEYRSLRSWYNIKSSLAGTMKRSGTIVNEGQRVLVEMSGPVTIETITKLK